MMISTVLEIKHDCLSVKLLALDLKITQFLTEHHLDYVFLRLKNAKLKNELSIQSVSPF